MAGRETSTALVLTEYKEKDGLKYIKKHEIKFDIKDIDEYKKQFSELKTKGFVEEGTFESNKWVMTNQKEDRRRAIFHFPFEIYPDFQISLKAFIAFMVNIKKQDVNTLDGYLSYINQIAIITNMFSEDKIEALKGYYKQFKIDNDGITKTLFQNKTPLLRFITFLNLPYGNEYINLINNEFAGYKYKLGVRDLPPFEDLIIFGAVVEDFFNDTDTKHQHLRNKYAVVKVWWELTTIIPVRVGEFIRFKADALNYNKIEDKYYLDIPRIKRNEKHEGEIINVVEYEIQTLEVTIEVANLISEYKNKYVQKEQKFLFSSNILVPSTQKEAKVHKLKFPNNKESKVYSKYNKVNKINVGAKGFAYIVNSFLTTVVKGIYGHDILRKTDFKNPEDKCDKIVAIQAGDTRHIAIGSMVEMGVNPLIIAKMSYHSNINTQLGYAQYIKKEAVIKSKALSKKLSGYYEYASKIIDSNLDIVLNSEINNDKAELTLKKGQGIKVKNGVCTSEYGPFNCTENSCYFCKLFIPIINKKNKEEIKVIVEKYRNEIYGKLQMVQESIEQLIKEVSRKSIKKDDGTFISEQKYVEELQTQYNKAVNLKNRLVVVEALSHLERKI